MSTEVPGARQGTVTAPTHRFEFHQPVWTEQRVVGRLTGWVLEPRQLRLTHIVLRPRVLGAVAHLVHVADLREQPGHVLVTLPDSQPEPSPDNKVAYVPLGGWVHATDNHDVGIVHTVRWPRSWIVASARDVHLTTHDLDWLVDYDNIPQGHVELDRASEVFDHDHHSLGGVHAVTVTAAGDVASLTVRRTLAGGHRLIDIPRAEIARVHTGEVHLDLEHNRTFGKHVVLTHP